MKVIYDYKENRNFRVWSKSKRIIGKLFILVFLAGVFISLLPTVTVIGTSVNNSGVPLKNLESTKEDNNQEENFRLVVPRLSINVPVSKNVDIGNASEISYYLKSGVAHAKDTALPDEKGTVFIFGHSSDFPWNNNKFGTIFSTLDTLSAGDDVALWYRGKNYKYKVNQVSIVNSNVTLGSLSISTPDRLILSSCWPVGTDWKRVLVTGDRMN